MKNKDSYRKLENLKIEQIIRVEILSHNVKGLEMQVEGSNKLSRSFLIKINL